jgi:hypothetical protein
MTSSDLIVKVKRNAAFPAGGRPGLDDDDLLDILTDEIQSVMANYLISYNEEFFTKYYDYTISAGSVYEIPARAFGSTIKAMKIISGTEILDVPKVELTEAHQHNTGFYFEGAYIRLANDTEYVGKTLRVYYYERPSALINPIYAAKITAINTGANSVTVDSVPADWTDSTVCDIVKGKTPFNILAIDQAITINITEITFSSLPTFLAVGDYVTKAEESPVANIPHESQALLVQSAVIKCLEILDDPGGILKISMTKFEQLANNLRVVMTPRAHDEKYLITNFDCDI